MLKEKTELVWLPKDLANRIKEVTDKDALEREILVYINKSRKELKQQIESFDEDVLIFRGQLAKAKAAFKDAQETHYNETYELWEKFDKDIISTKNFVDKAVTVLKPLQTELETINNLMRQISTWDLEKLLGLLENISGSDNQSREMLKFLFENFRREN